MSAARRLSAFLAQHNQTVPVSLNWVFDEYDVSRLDLSPHVLGVGHFDSALGVKAIAINRNAHPYTQRMALAHEVGHDILRHPDRLYTLRVGGDWFVTRAERQAQYLAAALLLPFDRLLDELSRGLSIGYLEDVFEVDHRLIEFRLDLAECGKHNIM